MLPLLYLHGLSRAAFDPKLTELPGTSRDQPRRRFKRLTRTGRMKRRRSNKQSLTGTDHVYCGVGGIHLKVRLQRANCGC